MTQADLLDSVQEATRALVLVSRITILDDNATRIELRKILALVHETALAALKRMRRQGSNG